MICRPLLRTEMIRAPMTVPTIEPVPPVSEVPPMTTAAIACSSYPSPVPGWADARRAEIITPARPVNRPASV
jgi:hypothetical protein